MSCCSAGQLSSFPSGGASNTSVNKLGLLLEKAVYLQLIYKVRPTSLLTLANILEYVESISHSGQTQAQGGVNIAIKYTGYQ